MAVTFHDLIHQNKRNSFLLAVLFSGFVIGLAGLMGYAYAGVYMPDQVYEIALGAMIIAAGLTVILLLISYFGGAGTVLAISRARPLAREDDPQLYNVVEEMCIAAGLPVPKIYIIDDTAPNAFATGRKPENAAVAITAGLREKLDRSELQGVIAHEISHIRNYDILFAMMMAVMLGVVVLLCDYFLRGLWYGGRFRAGRSRRSSGGKSSGGGAAVLLVVAIILSIVAPIIAKLIQLAVSRQREYLADASAVDLTRNPEGLACALEKIASDKEVLEVANRATQHLYIVNPIKPFEERAKKLFATHPPIKERIERIRALKVA